jgi:hypothetical protein
MVPHSLRDEIEAPGITNGHESPPPDDRVLALWRKVDAVCFDVDCTLTTADSLDLLAEFMGVGGRVASVTNAAMNGDVSLEQALEERLEAINCTPADIQAFLSTHPPASRLSPVRPFSLYHPPS